MNQHPLIDSYTIDQLQQLRKTLVRLFRDADRGQTGSLVFAKHLIPDISDNHRDEGQVLVIGGSNYISAHVERCAGQILVSDQQSDKLPVFHTKEIFLEFVASKIQRNTRRLGLNFAYPMAICRRGDKLDGALVRSTKEHAFQNLIGTNVGETIERYMQEQFGQKVDVVTANDTVCLVLSGLALDRAERLVAGVIGTGFNFGFYLDNRTVVNLESGNFNNFTPTDSGRHIDSASHDPGMQLWEKEVAGAYLFMHYNYYADRLSRDTKRLSNTKELSDLAAGRSSGTDLARAVMRRSASLAAVQMAAIFDFKGRRPMTVIIEGSLYWKGWRYRETVAETIVRLGLDTAQVNMVQVDNSSVMGGARLIF